MSRTLQKEIVMDNNNYLKNNLEILLIGLQELNLLDSRAAVVDALELLAGEIDASLLAIKNQAHVFLDEDDIEKVNKCSQIRKMMENLSDTIISLQDVSPYDCIRNGDNSSADFSIGEKPAGKPIAFTLKGKGYNLHRSTWRQLLYQVMCVLAELDTKRFEEFVVRLQAKNVTYYQFSENSDDLISDVYKNKPWPISNTNLYVRLTGDATVMWKTTQEALKFFNLTTSFSVETSDDE